MSHDTLSKVLPCLRPCLAIRGVRTGLLSFTQILVQGDALHLQEAGADGLCRSETCSQGVVQGLYFASAYHALQLCHTETGDVFMHIVEALAAHALQYEVAVQANFLTEAVAAEGAVLPLFPVVLHPEIDALEAMEVCFVEVLLVVFHLPLPLFLAHLADDGARQLQGQRLQRAEHEVEIQYREEQDIDGQQPQVIEDGDIGIEDYRQAHRYAVANQIARHIGMAGDAMGKAEDVHDVVDAKPQRAQAHQDVAAQNVGGKLLRRIDIHNAAAHQGGTCINGKHNQDGTRIMPHTLPLQKARHRDVQRVDALQIACTHQCQQHAGMQDAGLSRGNRMAEEGSHKRSGTEDAVHPCQAQVLYPVPRKQAHHTGYHEMNNGRTAQSHEKNILAHSRQQIVVCKVKPFQSNRHPFAIIFQINLRAYCK